MTVVRMTNVKVAAAGYHHHAVARGARLQEFGIGGPHVGDRISPIGIGSGAANAFERSKTAMRPHLCSGYRVAVEISHPSLERGGGAQPDFVRIANGPRNKWMND